MNKTTIRRYPRRDLREPEKRRSVEELLSLSDPSLRLSRDMCAIKNITKEEASDLWAVGKTIHFCVGEELDAGPSFHLNKFQVKADDDPLINSLNFFGVIESVVPNYLPKSRSIYFFIKIPIKPKVAR